MDDIRKTKGKTKYCDAGGGGRGGCIHSEQDEDENKSPQYPIETVLQPWMMIWEKGP